MQLRSALVALACLALLGCGGAGERTPPADQAGGAEKTMREVPATILQPGEEATYLPGEVVPGKTTIWCRASTGERLGQVVPRPGSGAVAIGDPAPGYRGITIRVDTMADGSVKASCGETDRGRTGRAAPVLNLSGVVIVPWGGERRVKDGSFLPRR